MSGAKVVFISGAAAGIGAAIAQLAVQRGHRVVIGDINLAAAQETASRLGGNTLALELDVRSEEQWQRALDAAWAQCGTVDVLVNNAGIIHPGYASKVSMAQHRAMVEVNYLGSLAGMLSALPRFKAQGRGHLITICSMASFIPMPGLISYAGTKHALRATHHGLALEERDSPVDFTVIHPPAVETAMLRHEQDFDDAALAFADGSVQPSVIAEAVVKAIDTKPRELIWPPVLGNVMRLFGATPGLVYRELIKAQDKGRRLLAQRRKQTAA